MRKSTAFVVCLAAALAGCWALQPSTQTTPPPAGSPAGTPSTTVTQPAAVEVIADAVVAKLHQDQSPLAPWADLIKIGISALVASYATHKAKDSIAAAKAPTA
jgi:hypothetical protein